MKRLLAISWEMPPMYGPRATQVSRVLSELPANGWSPTVVCMDPKPNGPHWFDAAAASPSNLRLVRIPSAQESFVVRAIWRMLPLSIGTSALMQRSKVDLPDPDGPMMQTTPPLGTSIDTPLSTSTLPNDLWTSRSETIGRESDSDMALQVLTAYRASSRTVQRAIG